MKPLQLILILALSTATAFVTSTYISKPTEQGVVQESAYERVLRTKVLRCGYADWPPYGTVKDPITGKMSGIFPDVMEAIAKKLDLTIEWTENTGWGSFIESLRTHRIDVFCSGAWRSAQRGRYAAFTSPVFYSAIYPYVPVNEHRFDNDLFAANSPDARISAMDGEMSDIVAKQYFSKAKEISVPQLGQITDILVNVAEGKANIVFNEPSFVEAYMKANPGKIRRLQDKPFQVFATPIVIEIHELQLREMLDSALMELQNQGVVDQIISKYNDDPTVFLRVAKPYSQP